MNGGAGPTGFWAWPGVANGLVVGVATGFVGVAAGFVGVAA